ncbi:uncharacterized protein LOC143559604 [Bidens hawaiensis]|uniref:uncharacterized protein LOC143559604 n=1 Tax=Bidens hawaiensis TaxID=980011 RepID=UPI00404AAA7A
MSNHTNNTRHLSRLPSNAYARYISGTRVNFDFIPPPSLPFLPTLNESAGVDPWLWSLPERNLTLPSTMISFPRPRMQLVVFRNNVANNNNMRSRPTEQHRQQRFELTPNEQRKALKKLRGEVFNPTPKKIIQRLGRFYRQNDATKPYEEDNNDDDDDDKRCVICLEVFEPKEVVMVTPCNHMFHEDCIFPWVKSNGKCPVCRFSFCGDESGASSTNNDNMINDQLTNGLISLVTLTGGSTTIEPSWI